MALPPDGWRLKDVSLPLLAHSQELGEEAFPGNFLSPAPIEFLHQVSQLPGIGSKLINGDLHTSMNLGQKRPVFVGHLPAIYSGLLTVCRQQEYHRGDAPRARPWPSRR